MREATVSEYGRVTMTPHAEKRIMHAKRSTTVIWTYKSHEIASKTELLTRGKVTQTMYSINPDFLNGVPEGVTY